MVAEIFKTFMSPFKKILATLLALSDGISGGYTNTFALN